MLYVIFTKEPQQKIKASWLLYFSAESFSILHLSGVTNSSIYPRTSTPTTPNDAPSITPNHERSQAKALCFTKEELRDAIREAMKEENPENTAVSRRNMSVFERTVKVYFIYIAFKEITFN